MFRFLSDPVASVSYVACKAFGPIVIKFGEDEPRQAAVCSILIKRFFRANSFKKREKFVMICDGELTKHKEIFERYFKLDLLSLVGDRVPNVRIMLAEVLKNNQQSFVGDKHFNEAVIVLKKDANSDVRLEVSEIPTPDDSDEL